MTIATLGLIHRYIGFCTQAAQTLRTEFGTHDLLRAARASPTARTGELPNGARYEFHGVGCRYSSSTFVVDFDFGPDGRTDGFDAWRLALFAETQGAEFSQSLAEIDSDLHQLMKEGAVIAPRLSPSEHLLYLAREKPSGVEGRTVSQK